MANQWTISNDPKPPAADASAPAGEASEWVISDSATHPAAAKAAPALGPIERLQQMPEVLTPHQEQGAPWFARATQPGQRSKAEEFVAGTLGSAQQMAVHPWESLKSMVMTPGPSAENVPLKEAGRWQIPAAVSNLWADKPGTRYAVQFREPDLAAMRERVKRQWEFVKQHPAYTAGSLVGPVIASEIVGAGAPPLFRGAVRGVGAVVPEPVAGVARNIAQRSLGAGERFQTGVVEKFGRESEAARTAQRIATERTEEQWNWADQQKELARIEHLSAQATRTADYTAAQREAFKKQAEWLLDQYVRRVKHQEALGEHAGAVERAGQERSARENMLANRQAAEGQHAQATQNYLQTERAERTRFKGLENSAWARWRAKIANITSVNDPTLLSDLRKSTESYPTEVGGVLRRLQPRADAVPPESEFAQIRRQTMENLGMTDPYEVLNELHRGLIDRVMDEQVRSGKVAPPEPINLLEPKEGGLSVNQIHTARGILGNMIRSGSWRNNPAIEGEMMQIEQRLARAEVLGSQQAGAEAELNEARQSTQNYQEAFGRERTPRSTKSGDREKDRAAATLRQEAEAQRLADVERHSPQVAQAARELDQATDFLDLWPEEDELRRSLGTIAQPGEPPVLKMGRPRPEDAPVPPPVPPPKATIGSRVIQREVPVAPSTYFPEPPNLHEEISETARRRLRDFSGLGQGAITLTIGGIASYLMSGGYGTFAHALTYGAAGFMAMSALLEQSDAAMSWLSRELSPHSMRVIEALPAADANKLKTAMTQIGARAAAKSGGAVNLSPSVTRWLGPQNAGIIEAAAKRTAQTAAAPPIPQTPLEAKERVHEMRHQIQAGQVPPTKTIRSTEQQSLINEGKMGLQGIPFSYRGMRYTADSAGLIHDATGAVIDTTRMTPAEKAALEQAGGDAMRAKGIDPQQIRNPNYDPGWNRRNPQIPGGM